MFKPTRKENQNVQKYKNIQSDSKILLQIFGSGSSLDNKGKSQYIHMLNVGQFRVPTSILYIFVCKVT